MVICWTIEVEGRSRPNRTLLNVLDRNFQDDKPTDESLTRIPQWSVEVTMFFRVFRQQDKSDNSGAGHIAERLYKIAKILLRITI